MIRVQSAAAGEGILEEVLRALHEHEGDMQEASGMQTSGALASGAVSASLSVQVVNSSNMTARNFASSDRGSRNTSKPRGKGCKLNRSMDNQEQDALTSVLQQAKMEYESTTRSGERYKILKRAEKNPPAPAGRDPQVGGKDPPERIEGRA